MEKKRCLTLSDVVMCFPIGLVPAQLGDEVWCMYGDHVPVNLRSAVKSTDST